MSAFAWMLLGVGIILFPFLWSSFRSGSGERGHARDVARNVENQAEERAILEKKLTEEYLSYMENCDRQKAANPVADFDRFVAWKNAPAPGRLDGLNTSDEMKALAEDTQKGFISNRMVFDSVDVDYNKKVFRKENGLNTGVNVFQQQNFAVSGKLVKVSVGTARYAPFMSKEECADLMAKGIFSQGSIQGVYMSNADREPVKCWEIVVETPDGNHVGVFGLLFDGIERDRIVKFLRDLPVGIPVSATGVLSFGWFPGGYITKFAPESHSSVYSDDLYQLQTRFDQVQFG